MIPFPLTIPSHYKSPSQISSLVPFQHSATDKIIDLGKAGNPACLLLAGVGTGKTFIGGAILRALQDHGYHSLSPSPCALPYWWITVNKCIEAVKREMDAGFGIKGYADGTLIEAYSQLRAGFGTKHLFSEDTIVKDGEAETVYNILFHMIPSFILLDEAHQIKNPSSLQSKVISSITKLRYKYRPFMLFMTATACTRVIDLKQFLLAANIPIHTVFGGSPSYNEDGSVKVVLPSNINEVMAELSTDKDPLLHSPSAIESLMKVIEPYIVRVPPITGRNKVFNGCRLINFKNKESADRYNKAYNKFIEKCRSINRETAEGKWALFVALGQYRKAAELERAESLVDEAMAAIKEGKSVGIATIYKGTIARAVRYAVKTYGMSRDDISLIWGGDETFEKKKHIPQEKILEYIQKRMIDPFSVSNTIWKQIQKQTLMADEDKAEIEEFKDVDLRLGPQDQKTRQVEIDRFQLSRTRLCFYTLSAGGVGLSLHDTYQWFEIFYKKFYTPLGINPSTGKKEYKHNRTGIVYSPRQRVGFITPPYSAQDFIQGLGRLHRSMFSESNTTQQAVFFDGTVEVEVMQVVSNKLRCLQKTLKAKESWDDVVYNASMGGTTHAVAEEVRKQSEELVEAGEDVVDSESNEEDEE